MSILYFLFRCRRMPRDTPWRLLPATHLTDAYNTRFSRTMCQHCSYRNLKRKLESHHLHIIDIRKATDLRRNGTVGRRNSIIYELLTRERNPSALVSACVCLSLAQSMHMQQRRASDVDALQLHCSYAAAAAVSSW